MSTAPTQTPCGQVLSKQRVASASALLSCPAVSGIPTSTVNHRAGLTTTTGRVADSPTGGEGDGSVPRLGVRFLGYRSRVGEGRWPDHTRAELATLSTSRTRSRSRTGPARPRPPTTRRCPSGWPPWCRPSTPCASASACRTQRPRSRRLAGLAPPRRRPGHPPARRYHGGSGEPVPCRQSAGRGPRHRGTWVHQGPKPRRPASTGSRRRWRQRRRGTGGRRGVGYMVGSPSGGGEGR